MGLNIKNERVHELARQAAAATGLSQTGAVEEALRRLLEDYGEDPERRRRAAKVDIVHGIVRAYLGTPADPDRQIERVEDLFDDRTGLPR
ncbi:MAG TPA: hypothetical protein DER11_05830 [Janibacter terrae]|uniref:type II toxin-antitoxin system VapB family antitoxin n=1 Tax=Janibacter terrae TaxID=103817 RepID=UPI00083937F3|nr:type II toxin-antitoxin system VapB family antitoxin [Janibacter terrae]MBA4085919.1 hypothetical protein [Kytococcus sp.]HCE60895.1 hypothetical protein [Janibacter terrae]